MDGKAQKNSLLFIITQCSYRIAYNKKIFKLSSGQREYFVTDTIYTITEVNFDVKNIVTIMGDEIKYSNLYLPGG
jgi:hydroxylamine reductase (hybrid-cluster protein)